VTRFDQGNGRHESSLFERSSSLLRSSADHGYAKLRSDNDDSYEDDEEEDEDDDDDDEDVIDGDENSTDGDEDGDEEAVDEGRPSRGRHGNHKNGDVAWVSASCLL
jgi:hypothetical protein